MNNSASTDLAKEFLSQSSSPARQAWLEAHANDGETLLWSLKALSARHYHTDPQRALEIANAAREAAQRLNSPALTGLAHWITANALVFLERHAEAVTHFEQAQQLLEVHGAPAEIGQMLVGYIFSLTYLDRYQEALAQADKARPLLTQAGDGYRLGLLAMNVGVAHDLREAYEDALAAYEMAASHFRSLHDGFNLARAMVNMGIVYAKLDRYVDAERVYRQAEHAFALENARLEQGRIALNLGVLFVRQGRYGESLAAFQEARRHFETLNVPLQSAEVDLYESQTLIALNLFPEAETLSGHALAILESQEQHREAALAAHVHARALMEQGAYEQAAASFSRALARFEQLGLTRQADRVRLAMAESAYRQGDVQDAYAAAQAIIVRAEEDRQPTLQSQALLLAGRALLADQQIDQAQAYFMRARQIVIASSLPGLTIQAYDGLTQIAMAQEAWLTARDHQQQALDLILELRRRIPGAARRAAFLSDKMPLLRRAVHTALVLDDVEGALAIMAQMQSGPLAESLLTPPTDPESLQRWQSLRTQLQDLKRAWRWRVGEEPDRSFDSDEDVARGVRGNTDVRVLEQRIDRTWRQLQSLCSPRGQDASPAALRSRKPPVDGSSLVYFPAEEVVWGIGTMPTGEIALRQLGTVQTLRRLLQRWQGHLHQIQSLPPDYLRQHQAFLLQAARRVLRKLFDFLIAPFVNHLREDDRLWIVPHDMLYFAPFAALYDGERYLAEKHQIVFGAMTAAEKGDSSVFDERTISLVGAYSHDGALPHAAYEATVVHELTPRSVLLLEQEMTLDALRALLGQADLVHLATHAAFRGDNPLFSYLQLADGRLTAHDLENVRLRAQLVVLSACETGRSGALGGDMVGLTQAFLAAGARSLLVSQWRLHDPMAASFMETFYRTPDAVARPVQALTRTMRHFLAMDPEIHPYFWAPFVLMQG